MTELNLKNRPRQWSLVHKYEVNSKKRSLRKLSERAGFKMFQDLYKFVCNSKTRSTFNILDMDKINTLAEIHSIFGRIKT